MSFSPRGEKSREPRSEFATYSVCMFIMLKAKTADWIQIVSHTVLVKTCYKALTITFKKMQKMFDSSDQKLDI